MKPETELQKRIQDALEAMGIWVIPMAVTGKRSNRSVRTGEEGLPDLLLPTMGPGFLEVKIGKGKLSPAQRAWHERARKEGVWVAIAWSLEEAIRLVRERQDYLRQEPLLRGTPGLFPQLGRASVVRKP